MTENYYSMKRQANATIDKLHSEGVPEAEIIYKISLKYGIGAGSVKRRIKEYNDMLQIVKDRVEGDVIL